MTTKKKIFPRVDLDIPKVEVVTGSFGQIVIPTDAMPPADSIIRFPTKTNARADRMFNFDPWYGHGIDVITCACQRQIERFLATHDRGLSVTTIVNYCTLGLKRFLDYMVVRRAALDRDLVLADLNRDTVDGFLGYLKDRGVATLSQRMIYISTKPVLSALGDNGLIRIIATGDQATFPKNPFPGVTRKAKGEAPLPKGQRRMFTAAVKTAVMPLFREDAVPTSELLGYALLIVSLHTGRNTVPLIEMTADCLRAHPKENTRFLVVYKRRGNKSSTVALRADPTSIESTPSVRPTVARMIERVIGLTDPLREEASEEFKDRLWLYRSRQGGHAGEVVPLSPAALADASSKLVRNAALTEPDGRPLRINCARLRKTFINRVNEILGDDIVTTAVAAGNTPRLVGTTYLRPGESAAKNWRFMGEVLTKELLTNTLGATEKTPTGRCTDSKRGQFAPKKDGATCISFLDCLRCRNYVVTGDDLYRLFSFYWRIYKERDRVDRRKWEQRYAHIPRLIERDVIAVGLERKAFNQSQVDSNRERARIDPHPYWTADGMLEALE